MEVVFVDVGFGTCNLILTGSGGAIVIDAGERPKEPLAVLHHFSVSRIRHLIVSHWHDDHVGGATGVLRAYANLIGNIWFPTDPAFQKTEFWTALVEETKLGSIRDEQIRPLMLESAAPRVIWSSPTQNADLSIVSPCLMEANRGIAAGNSNATCGILVLRVAGRYIVFAGDATLAQWQGVSKRIRTPISADVLAVPHHAGIMWPDRWTAAQIATALDNLYSKLVIPSVAVISASTRPGTKHPRADVVAALRRANASVMCTQITSRCTSDLEAARKLRASLPIVAPGRSSPVEIKTKAKHSNHVACAGSVIVEILPTGTIISQLNSHRTMVTKLPNQAGQVPLCK